MAKAQRALLPPDEEEKLKQLAGSGSPAQRQRAQAVLAWHDGLTANDTAKKARLSVNQVNYLWRLYRRKGLELFMVDIEPTPSDSSLPPLSTPKEPEVVSAVTLEALCAQYNIDVAHARQVAALSLSVFDATMSVHRLPQNIRPLVEAAAIVHNIAYESDPENHHITGRDILVNTPIRGFSEDERRILACTTSFHRKKVKPDTDPVYTALPTDLRRDALSLAAILRIADGLDYHQGQTTTIADIQVTSENVLIQVDGPEAESDAKQSQKKADLWNTVFTTPVRVRKVEAAQVDMPKVGADASEASGTRKIMPSLSPSLNPTMSVARVGRNFALHTLERIETLLKKLQSGDQSVLPLLARETYRLIDATTLADVKDFRKEIRSFYEGVENARLAVTLAERAAPLVDEPGEAAAQIADRVRQWAEAGTKAAAAVEADKFRKLATDLRLALVEDADPNENALISFHVGSILWGQLTALRQVMEHGTSVDEALEAVRRLQDHLYAFRSLLGPEIAQALDMMAPFESYLSTIRTTQHVMARLEPEPPKKPRGRAKKVESQSDPALDLVRKSQNELLDTLADELPALWNAVNSAVFRRSFALAIAAI